MTQDELREKLTKDIYEAMQKPYLSERHDAILSLIQQVERNAVDNVLDELLEWYDIKSQMSAQPFNWNGAVKALKASRDHKKPFNVLKAELENKK